MKSRFSSYAGRHDDVLTVGITNNQASLPKGWTMKHVGWVAMQIMGLRLLTLWVKPGEEAHNAMTMLETIRITPVNDRQVVLSCQHPLARKYFDGWGGYPKTTFFNMPGAALLLLEMIVTHLQFPKDIHIPDDNHDNKIKEDHTLQHSEKDAPGVIVDGGDGDGDEDDLPEVPLAPPDVDLDANVKEARKHRWNLLWLAYMVWDFHPWDYKRLGKKHEYDDFGNFHFGLVASALGVHKEILMRGPGFYQEFRGLFHDVGEGTYDPKFGHAWEDFPYGDDPKDQEQILKGIEYYEKLYKNKQIQDPPTLPEAMVETFSSQGDPS